MKTKAFTMAEVLITLGIIGIVAAMTFPGVIEGYQKVQTVNKLKKVYSVIQQAIQRAEVDHEHAEFWDFTLPKEKFTEIYIKPYYQILTDYDKANFPKDYHTYCRDERICDSYGQFQRSSRIVLIDGTLLGFNNATTIINNNRMSIITIIADINGFQKPNQYGKDIFLFEVEPEKGLMPYGLGITAGLDNSEETHTRNYLLKGENRSCQKDGIYCAAIIMMDNWEIRDDYHW